MPDYQTARKYWNKLKERLKNEGSHLVTNCHQLKMQAEDGKLRLTDTADAETILRLVHPRKSPRRVAATPLYKEGFDSLALIVSAHAREQIAHFEKGAANDSSRGIAC